MGISKKRNRAALDLQAMPGPPAAGSATGNRFGKSANAGSSTVPGGIAATDIPSPANAAGSIADKVRRHAVITAVSVAVAIAGIGFGAWQASSAYAQTRALSSQCTSTLVCMQPIAAGEAISEEKIALKPVPNGVRCADALGEEALGTEKIIGKVALVGLSEGTQIRQAYLAGSGNANSLAGAITPGFEAISIKVDSETGLACLLHVGDVVRVTRTDSTSQGGTASSTITDSARVIALDSSLQSAANYTTVTLEVSAAQADTIRAARLTSVVSLTMAGLSQTESESTDSSGTGSETRKQGKESR